MAKSTRTVDESANSIWDVLCVSIEEVNSSCLTDVSHSMKINRCLAAACTISHVDQQIITVQAPYLLG